MDGPTLKLGSKRPLTITGLVLVVIVQRINFAPARDLVFPVTFFAVTPVALKIVHEGDQPLAVQHQNHRLGFDVRVIVSVAGNCVAGKVLGHRVFGRERNFRNARLRDA